MWFIPIQNSNPTNVLEFGFQKHEVRIHEAQKPLQLTEFLITTTTKERQIVLDPFMGSGTTAVAAIRLKMHFIGFEIVPEFHAKALSRLDQETGTHYIPDLNESQLKLFEKLKKGYGS